MVSHLNKWYVDCEILWWEAYYEQYGVKMKFRTAGEAKRMRVRLHKFRQMDCDENRLKDTDHPLFAISAWDKMTVFTNGCELYISHRRPRVIARPDQSTQAINDFTFSSGGKEAKPGIATDYFPPIDDEAAAEEALIKGGVIAPKFKRRF